METSGKLYGIFPLLQADAGGAPGLRGRIFRGLGAQHFSGSGDARAGTGGISEGIFQNEGTLVGFCVLGGVFSEGIDLSGEKLIGAFIVGTGLPQIGSRREILREYYDKRGENGFDHAYRYPGMNKVLQAAGRVIRTAEDVGVILLMDERFLNREYQSLFPVEWEDRTTRRLQTVEDKLADFWRKIIAQSFKKDIL